MGDTGSVTTEIERKFLLRELPPPERLGDGVALRQGYLAIDGSVALRIRITPDRCVLTVKAGAGIQRTEVEREVTVEEADALWAHTGGRHIDKVRHRVPLADGLIAELDRYHGHLEGLATVEVEFPDLDTAAAFVPPDWFGRDVSEEPGWSNAELALHGRPSTA